MERQVISIIQEVERHSNRKYVVIITVNDDESDEYTFHESNGIYPIYKSLMVTLRRFENADVLITTPNTRFVNELNDIHDTTGTLATALSKLIKQRNISIVAEKDGFV